MKTIDELEDLLTVAKGMGKKDPRIKKYFNDTCQSVVFTDAVNITEGFRPSIGELIDFLFTKGYFTFFSETIISFELRNIDECKREKFESCELTLIENLLSIILQVIKQEKG
jgi:hypothetical protein